MKTRCGQRDMLTHCLRYGLRPSITWATIPVGLPGEQTSTEWEPGHRLWSDLSEYNRLPGILDVSQLVGYVWADEPRSAASVCVTGFDPKLQAEIAKELAQRYWDARNEFHFEVPTGTIEETIAQAMALKTQPVVISDSGDNPGGGGNSDQTFFLQALLKAGVTNVLLGGMTDQPATEACYKAGVGATLPLSIGATLDPKMCSPVKVTATVKSLTKVDDVAEGQAVVEFNGITGNLVGLTAPLSLCRGFPLHWCGANEVQNRCSEVRVSQSDNETACQSSPDGPVSWRDRSGHRPYCEQASGTDLAVG